MMRCRILLLLVSLYALGAWRTHVVESANDAKLPLNGLVLGYYQNNTKCTKAEQIIQKLVKKAWKADRSITPALLRLVYSDCLVTGCDASILLDGKTSEKTAPQNAGLRGFEVIEMIKAELEAKCPGVVSCADILQLATRDAVALAGGWDYPVFTGRRDGNASDAKSVDLPSPYISWDDAVAYFQSRGLSVLDLGTLLGAHTMGVAHCRYVHDRIYNFNDTGLPDESMTCELARQLARTCPYKYNSSDVASDPAVFLNPTSKASKYAFDSSYYARVLSNQTVLAIDQQFTSSMDGVRIAAEYAYGFDDFKRYFALSINRMGSIGVLTGKKGSIRHTCSVDGAALGRRTN